DLPQAGRRDARRYLPRAPRRASAMLDRHDPSPFIDRAAVEVWDTCIRWRERGRLHDVSIEATWERAAAALAGAAPHTASHWCSRMVEVQAGWELVLDERILAGAGTPGFEWPRDPLVLLNAAAFVHGAFGTSASFDFDRWCDVAR